MSSSGSDLSTVALGPEDWRRWRDRLSAVPHNLVLVRDATDVGMVSLAAPGELRMVHHPVGRAG